MLLVLFCFVIIKKKIKIYVAAVFNYGVCMRPSFPFNFESGMWDLNVLISDHCHSINFSKGQ